MLQNAKVTDFTVSELLRENLQKGGGGGGLNYKIRVKVQFLKMTRYSVQPKDRIFVNSHGVLSFARNICKNISKN